MPLDDDLLLNDVLFIEAQVGIENIKEKQAEADQEQKENLPAEDDEKLDLVEFPNNVFEIAKLDNDFGPAAIEGDVGALVVSEETSSKGELLNKLRLDQDQSPVAIIVVPMVLAKDGSRISTTRIRNSEIDAQGNIC